MWSLIAVRVLIMPPWEGSFLVSFNVVDGNLGASFFKNFN